MDMQTGAYYLGAPEYCRAALAGAAMADYYGLPLRTGGGLTDAWGLDFSAGYQSAVTLMTALVSGADFVLHACGILGSYLAVSLEKFVADEEILSFGKKALKPPEITEENLCLEAIFQTGPGGEFLTHETTYAACRTAFTSFPLSTPRSYEAAESAGTYLERAVKEVARRLDAYEQPPMDPGLKSALEDYTARRKKEIENG